MSASQNQSPILRNLTVADAEWMAALHATCFAEPQRWNAEAICALLLQPTTKALGLLIDGNPAGFIINSLVAGESEILTLAVHPDARRKGYAKQLIESFIAAHRAEHLEKIFLEVMETNIAALALYHALGFTIISKRTNYYTVIIDNVKKNIDGIVMAKQLTPLTTHS